MFWPVGDKGAERLLVFSSLLEEQPPPADETIFLPPNVCTNTVKQPPTHTRAGGAGVRTPRHLQHRCNERVIDWKHNRSSCSESGTHAAGTAALEAPLGLPPRLKVCINQKTLFTFQKRIRGRISIAACREVPSGLPRPGLRQQRDAFEGRGNSNLL